MKSPERNDARRHSEYTVDNFWIGRFVRITNQYNDNFHERGQVVDHHNGIVVIRYATGQHAASSTQGVCMDSDQTTPV